jgi:hypothetical protein
MKALGRVEVESVDGCHRTADKPLLCCAYDLTAQSAFDATWCEAVLARRFKWLPLWVPTLVIPDRVPLTLAPVPYQKKSPVWVPRFLRCRSTR